MLIPEFSTMNTLQEQNSRCVHSMSTREPVVARFLRQIEHQTPERFRGFGVNEVAEGPQVSAFVAGLKSDHRKEKWPRDQGAQGRKPLALYRMKYAGDAFREFSKLNCRVAQLDLQLWLAKCI